MYKKTIILPEISKNLTKYVSENNFIESSK